MGTLNCSSFESCVNTGGNSLPSGGAATKINTVGSLGAFAINFVVYGVYSILLFMLFYFLFVGIYKIIFGDDTVTLKVGQEALLRALMAVIGLLFVSAVFFVISTILKGIGLTEGEIGILFRF